MYFLILFQEDMTKTVKVKGVDVNVKSVALKDETDSIKVSLWRNLSDSSIVGKYLSITNVVVTSFNEEISVSTTSKSILEVRWLCLILKYNRNMHEYNIRNCFLYKLTMHNA